MHPFLLVAAILHQGGTPPKVSLKFANPSVQRGGTVDGTLTVTFASGLHAYQNPPSPTDNLPVEVKVVESGFSLLKATYPKGKDFSMPGETKPSKIYEGTISIPIKVRAASTPALYNVNVQFDYQECNAVSCFPPGKVIAKATLTVK